MHSTLECLFLLEVAMEITTDSGRARFSLARGIKQILSLPVLGALHLLDVIVGSLERLIGHKRMPYLFVLPNMLIFFIFVLLPLILNFLFAFTGGSSIVPENRTWVGLGNFERLFDCVDITNVSTCREDVFFFAVRNTFLFVIVEVPSMIVLALLVALALNRDIRLRGFFRSAFFFPVLLSPVVVALIWKWMLQTRGGLINTLLGFFGVEPIAFVLDGGWMMFWAIFVSIWAQLGFYALILLAGLQGIPPVLYEAAEIDGASELQRFWKVTLPLLRPTLLVVLVLTLIRGVQMFDHVYVLTGGGPGTATVLTVQYIYRTAFEPPNNWGMAAAVSLMLAAVLAVLTIIQLILNRRQTESL
jgi:alpha-1,4-digalacturonate transport system permease protein